MTTKYNVGDQVRITEDMTALTGSEVTIPREDAAQIAGRVGSVKEVAPVGNLPYRVDVPDIDWWWFREQDLSPVSETTSDTDVSDPVAELVAFKARVVGVATRYAKEYDMCDAVDRALSELGLERSRTRYTFTVTVDVPGYAKVDTLRSDVHRAIDGLIEFDSDWDGARFVRPDGGDYGIAVQVTRVE